MSMTGEYVHEKISQIESEIKEIKAKQEMDNENIGKLRDKIEISNGLITELRIVCERIQATNENQNKTLENQNRILDELMKDGISKENLSLLEFDEEKEEEKAMAALDKFVRKQSNKSLNKLKQDAYAHLINKGFKNEIASCAIEKYSFDYDQDYEKEILRQQINKYILSHHLNEKQFSDKQRIISYFVRKGFSYNMIISLLGGKENG